ncbi:MAG: 3-methyl-2-oxobutanoate hydroxymethyltransferase [Planctomycetes bacterium]|nr:3-methyl-2-oxobutanoate hydroxymethyltransferase [Planctomycetota bacterium]
MPARVTLRTIQRTMREGKRFACLTCYDATIARWLERAGLPMILVGDTLAEIVLGHDQTYYATMDIMVALTAAVRRGAPNVLLMADMPFMSYQADDAEGLRNAGRFMQEAGADLVKLEVDQSFAELVRKMSRAGIPVVSHIGSRPQQTKLTGGYRSTGRTQQEAERLLEDARILEEAGSVMLLVEATPAEVTEQIVAHTRIPVIGCGAGPACHGQVIVLHDLLGLTDWQPKFAQPVTHIGERIMEAARTWISRVSTNDLGAHPYHMVRDRAAPTEAAPETEPRGEVSSPLRISTAIQSPPEIPTRR